MKPPAEVLSWLERDYDETMTLVDLWGGRCIRAVGAHYSCTFAPMFWLKEDDEMRHDINGACQICSPNSPLGRMQVTSERAHP